MLRADVNDPRAVAVDDISGVEAVEASGVCVIHGICYVAALGRFGDKAAAAGISDKTAQICICACRYYRAGRRAVDNFAHRIPRERAYIGTCD